MAWPQRLRGVVLLFAQTGSVRDVKAVRRLCPLPRHQICAFALAYRPTCGPGPEWLTPDINWR